MRRRWCEKSQEGLDPPVPRHHFRGDESGWWAARALDRCKRSVGQPPGAQDGCGVLRLPGRTAHWRALIHQSEQHLLRSEEHTSELQSLMRISYAVFCLKKQTKKM